MMKTDEDPINYCLRLGNNENSMKDNTLFIVTTDSIEDQG